jgi:glycosyltransferase involved in cell wall biosynthesis
MRVRSAVGRSRAAQVLKRVRRRRRVLSAALPAEPLPGSAPTSRVRTQNVLLVSHCDFTGNSALHVYAIACELERRGLSPAIAVPGGARGVEDLGRPRFPVLSYRDVRKGKLRFDDTRGIDLVHAFTPREQVREVVVEIGRRYVVHLEDNEDAIVRRRSDPLRASEFLASASGVTVVVERLLELKPVSVPGAVVWPGFDEAVLSPERSREAVRAELGVTPDQFAIVYTGNVHESNVDEVASLYRAVGELRSRGLPAVLVKTGWNFVHRSRLPRLGDGLRDLGWVARRHVPELLAAADTLVQPGRPGPFNDFRFPSKLPEFLASGRPVVLPRTNIGLHLDDGGEALLLERGDADEIAQKVELLAAEPDLRTAIGARGREFALQELRWSKSVDAVDDLYRSSAST